LIAGIVGTFLSFFVINRLLRWWPGVAVYYHLLQILSLIILIAGVYFKGGYSTELEWREKVAVAEKKVAEAEAKSQQVNTVIKERVVKQLELVRTKGDDIIKYVDREVAKDNEVIKFVEHCPIPDIVVKTHNAAALNKPIEEKK
jgi:hypothetical protein